MRRLIPAILLLAAFAAGASAQTSNVTATITDADSQTWNNGTYTISFVQPPNDATAPVWNDTLMTPSQKIYTGSLSGSGVLTVALPDNTFITPGGSLWLFVICPNATAQCTQVSLKVSGASPDLSTTLSNATITPRFSALLNAFGYLDVEVTPTPVPGGQYFNVTNEVTRVWSGSAWANQGSSSGTGVTSVTGTAPIASSGGNTPAISCPTCALTSLTLAQFAATTSAQLAGVLSDETGTGLAVFGTSPTLTTPVIGAATGTSLNVTGALTGQGGISCGLLNTTSCVITGFGSTSGSATITWPAVAGTANNSILFSNTIQSSGGVTANGQIIAGLNQAIGITTRSLVASSADGVWNLTNNASNGFTKLTLGPGTSSFPALCPSGTTVLVGLANGTCTTLSPLTASAFNAGANAGVSVGPFTAITSITTTGGLVTALSGSSDMRLKSNIHPYLKGLAEILQLHPALYHWNKEGQKITNFGPDVEQAGFLAQDVQKALPEAVGTESHDGVDYLNFSDRPVLAALVNAVKEQQKEIEALKEKIEALTTVQ